MIVLANNCEDTISQSIESILGQTAWKRYDGEIIAVVNGCVDRTEQIVRTFEIRVIATPKPLGSAGAINAGYRNSSGDIIFPAFGDAVYAEDYIELCIGHLLGKGAIGSVYGSHSHWSDGSILGRYFEQARDVFHANYKPFAAWFYRRSDLERLGLHDRIQDEEIVGPDVLIADQIKSLGYRLAWEPKARFWHGRDYNSYRNIFLKGLNVGMKLNSNFRKRRMYWFTWKFFYSRLAVIYAYIAFLFLSIALDAPLLTGSWIGNLATLIFLPYIAFVIRSAVELHTKRLRTGSFKLYILFSGVVNPLRYLGIAVGFLYALLTGGPRETIRY